MNRRCRRCGLLQDHSKMHNSKEWHGWLCNDRANCTFRVIEDGYLLKEIK